MARRRRSSQPSIVIDEPQHSSVTTHVAPQIPSLNISPIGNGNQWYNPIDAASSPAHERTSIPPTNAVPRQESNNRDLTLPGHVDQADQQIRQTSPRVSALGSFHDGDLPSRSISEVTRPTSSVDERSPIATIAENFPPSTASERVPPDASGQPLLVTTVPTLGAGTVSTRVLSAPVSDALGPLPNLSTTASAVTLPVATEPNAAERDTLPVQDLKLKAQGQERVGFQLSDAPATPQSAAGAALPSQGGHLSQSRGDTPRAGIFNSGGSSEILHPPFNAGTPPHTVPKLSKEAEAAMYRSQGERPENLVDGLPAYPSTGGVPATAPKPRIAPGDAIIPIADLSHQRQTSSGPAPPRPFSFVGGDTIISSAGQNLVERLSTPLDAPSSRPDLAKEISVVSSNGSKDSLDFSKRDSKQYSRPFSTNHDVKDHPTYRHSQETARNKGTSVPSRENQNIRPVVDRPAKTVDDDVPYRIPGPYVQEYRSPKQPPQGILAQQFPAAQVRPQGQPNQRAPPGVDPLRSHAPRSQNQTAPHGQSAKNNEDHTTRAVTSPTSDRLRQPSKGGLFRTRSKSRSVRSRDDESRNAESKNEKRGGFFKQRTKADGATLPSQFGSLRGEPREGFTKQISHDSADHNAAHGEHADQVGNLESTRPNNSSPHDPRKKRFSGLGSLFGRSGTRSTKTSTKPQGPQPVQPASAFSNYPPSQPNGPAQHITAAPDSMYAQNQQRYQTLPLPDKSGSYPQPQAGFQGLNAPVAGYYAPSNQQQADRPKMPHDPDSFNRDRLSTEQQANPDQYPNEQNPNRHQRPYQPGLQPQGPQLPSAAPRPEEARPPLQINTNTSEFGAGHTAKQPFVTAPPGPAPQLPPPAQSSSEPPRQVPYYSTQRPIQGSPYDLRQGTQSPYRYGARQGASPSGVSHAIDLHKRSRSPRNGRTIPEDERIEEIDRNDPASQLGTFSKSAGKSPRGGGADSSEQEAPWRIGLPGNGEEDEDKRNTILERVQEQKQERDQPRDQPRGQELEQEQERERAQQDESYPTIKNENGNSSPAKSGKKNEEETENANPPNSKDDGRKREQAQLEPKPTVAEKVMGVQLPLKQTTGNAMQKSPVELPGSKAPGDHDSDDEIVMSSTAYPGQEWAPESWAYGGNWDD
jgi:hypothetical protein